MKNKQGNNPVPAINDFDLTIVRDSSGAAAYKLVANGIAVLFGFTVSMTRLPDSTEGLEFELAVTSTFPDIAEIGFEVEAKVTDDDFRAANTAVAFARAKVIGSPTSLRKKAVPVIGIIRPPRNDIMTPAGNAL